MRPAFYCYGSQNAARLVHAVGVNIQIKHKHSINAANMSAQSEFLTIKELPEITGFSARYFEKGRFLGYGPRFMRFNSGGHSGKVLDRRIDVESWMADMTCDPKGDADV